MRNKVGLIKNCFKTAFTIVSFKINKKLTIFKHSLIRVGSLSMSCRSFGFVFCGFFSILFCSLDCCFLRCFLGSFFCRYINRRSRFYLTLCCSRTSCFLSGGLLRRFGNHVRICSFLIRIVKGIGFNRSYIIFPRGSRHTNCKTAAQNTQNNT